MGDNLKKSQIEVKILVNTVGISIMLERLFTTIIVVYTLAWTLFGT